MPNSPKRRKTNSSKNGEIKITSTKTFPIIFMLDLDHCLLHFLKKEDVKNGLKNKDFCESLVTSNAFESTVGVRKNSAHLVRCLKSLGCELEIVTQNLKGKEILQALEESDFDTWRGLNLTVVTERNFHSKRLENTNIYNKYLKKGILIDKLREYTLILDDQEKSWCFKDIDRVIEVKKYDLLNEFEDMEVKYLKNLIEKDILPFFKERNEQNMKNLQGI